MILEYIDNGQVMYYNAQTAEFTSKVTGTKKNPCDYCVGGVLPEDIAKKYLFDIVLGLRYCIFTLIIITSASSQNCSSRHQA